jgi:hypothetical protein
LTLRLGEVWRRAEGRCEYCRIPSAEYRLPFQIDHIIAGRDPETGEIRPLYNPREDVWGDHFRLDGAVLVGLTGIGRATVQVLAMNEPEFLAVRETLIKEGVYGIG